jgi:hypothetical protein
MGDYPSEYTETIRHVEYQEKGHQHLLEGVLFRLYGAPDGQNPVDRNPFVGTVNPYSDTALFSEGYALANYPALYDMFGFHQAGMDIEDIWNQTWKDLMTPEEILAFVKKWIVLINEKYLMEIVPKFQQKMRDLNSVNSSTHLIGLADIEKQRVFEVEKASAEAQYAIATRLNQPQEARMNWHIQLIKRYAICILDWVTCNMECREATDRQVALQEVWGLTLEENMRKALAVFVPRTPAARNQMVSQAKSPAGQVIGLIGWTYLGYEIGSYFGPYGGLIGAVIGFVLGLADILFFQ